MESYNQRLLREITRRDIALANMKQCGHASTAIVIDKLEQTQNAVRAEINDLKTSLDPENIIRKYPWGTTLGAVLAGIVATLLIRSRHNIQPEERAAAESFSSNGGTAKNEIHQESWWKPLTGALLANLPSLIAAFIKRDAEPISATQRQSAASTPESAATVHCRD